MPEFLNYLFDGRRRIYERDLILVHNYAKSELVTLKRGKRVVAKRI